MYIYIHKLLLLYLIHFGGWLRAITANTQYMFFFFYLGLGFKCNLNYVTVIFY